MSISSFYRKTPAVVALLLLTGVGIWFSWDLLTLKQYLNHPEYVDYYPSFRTWFLGQLKSGHFPLWNPHWGLGHTSEIEASFPIDIYSLIELAVGTQYQWFYPVQAVGILVAGFISARMLSISIPLAFLCTLLFFFSPWVTYFFFYWIKANSFIGLWFSFLFGYRYLTVGGKRNGFLLALGTAFALSGTKFDFWFFHFAFLASLPMLVWFTSREHRRLSRVLCYFAALLLGFTCHAWQWTPMLQILRETNRLGSPLGIATLINGDFYFRLILSIVSSPFLKTLLICLTLASGLQTHGSSRRNIFIGSALIFILVKAWTLPPFSELISWFGSGALLAAGYLWGIRGTRPSKILRQCLFFLPLAIYWCRPAPQDLNEITILHSAPMTLQFVWGFLIFLSVGTLRSSFSKLLYTFLCLLFLYRDQGQVVLSHLFGLVWMPTRDNFLFDMLFSILAVKGLAWSFPKNFLAPTAALMSALIILPCAKNFYYAHPLISTPPAGYPFGSGRPELTSVLQSLKLRPESRVFFAGRDVAKDLSMYGTSLLSGVNQVHAFSSFMPSRYHDWSTYRWFGIEPNLQWSAYQGEYSANTIEKLPPRNTLGIPTNIVYWWALHAMPPPQLNALALLGVEKIISDEPILPQTGLSNPQALQHFFTADVNSPLPRAFFVDINDSKLDLWKTSLDAVPNSGGVRIGTLTFPITAVKIDDYKPETIQLQISSDKSQWLVLTDLYHPFWGASLNGEPIDIHAALNLFRMIKIPKGLHRVEFIARIPGFPTAVNLSALSIALLLLGLSISFWPFPLFKEKPINLNDLVPSHSPG